MVLGNLGGRFDNLGIFSNIGLSHNSGLMPQTLISPGQTYASNLYGMVAYKDEIHFFGHMTNNCGTFNLSTGELKYIDTVIPWTSSKTYTIGDGNPNNPRKLRILSTSATGVNLAKWYDATTRLHTDCNMSKVAETKTVYGKSCIFNFRDLGTSTEDHEIYKYDPVTGTETYISSFKFTNDDYVWAVCHIGEDQFYVFVRNRNTARVSDVYNFNGTNGNMSKIVSSAGWIPQYQGESQTNYTTPSFYGLVRCFYGGGDKIFLYSTSRANEAKPWIWAEYSISNQKFKILVGQDEFTPSGQSRYWCWDMLDGGVVATAKMDGSPISLSITKFDDASVTDCYRA